MIKISRAGLLYIALTIFLGVAAANTNNNFVFIVVSLLLSFMAISGFFGKANLSGLQFTVDLPREIYAGTSVPIKVTLENKRRFLPAFLIRFQSDTFASFFPFTDEQSSTSVYVHVTFDKRGLHAIQNIRISSVFPFSFFTRFKDIHQTFTCVVFPKLRSPDSHILFHEKEQRSGEQTADISGIDSDILSIREYVRGDPLKYIHWKATARTGRLKTKELSSFVHQPVILDFDKISVRNLEDKISFTAYTAVQLIKKNIPVGLRIRGILYRPDTSVTHKAAMLRALALYGSEHQPTTRGLTNT